MTAVYPTNSTSDSQCPECGPNTPIATDDDGLLSCSCDLQVELHKGDSPYISEMQIPTTKSRVTPQSRHGPRLHPMSYQSQTEPECPECGPHTLLGIDPDGWLSCSCGLQIEPVDVLESSRPMSELEPNTTSGGGHGDSTGLGQKLVGSVFSGDLDYAGNTVSKSWQHRSKFRGQLDGRSRAVLEGTRARRDTMRIIRQATQNSPTLQKEALYNLSKGWPEPKNRSTTFQTIASAGHPTPRESSAAACIFVAAERMGIRIPAHRIVDDIFTLNKITAADARKYLTRSIKCLRGHLGSRARQEATSSRLDSVLNSAFNRDSRLGPIHDRVRRFCHFWADYTGQSRVLDSPVSYAACAAYELGKLADIGMTLEDIEAAFEVSQGFRAKRSEVQDLLTFIESNPGVLG